MKICVLGSSGLLGQALMKCYSSCDILGVSKKKSAITLDISDDEALFNFFKKKYFDVVINTVAIVDFNICEKDKKLAYEINARPSALLAKLSKECGFKYIYISTDNYFQGDSDKKHDESESPVLLTEYARTKYAGEHFALTNSDSLVLRTNIVGFKKNNDTPTFLEWVFYSLKEHKKIKIFNDYYTSSITVAQFAKSLYDLIEKNSSGIVNLASRDVFSKARFIECIAKEFNFKTDNLEYGSIKCLKPARADSLGLNVEKAENILGYKLPNLEEVISQIKYEYNKL